jgi:hypothetical protein
LWILDVEIVRNAGTIRIICCHRKLSGKFLRERNHKVWSLFFSSYLLASFYTSEPTVAQVYGENGESCFTSFISESSMVSALHCMLSTYFPEGTRGDEYEEE